MTAIVGLVLDGKIFVGSDTQITSGCQRQFIASKWHLARGWAVAISGLLRPLNLVEQYSNDLFIDLTNPLDFILQFRDILLDDGIIKCKNTTGDDEDGFCQFMISNGKELWSVADDFSIIKAANNNMVAIGSGGEYAIGADHINKRISKDGLERVNTAIQTSIHYDVYSGGDIYLKVL